MTKTFNACIVCGGAIEFFGPHDDNCKGATTFWGTPGYGSRFDALPGVRVQIVVCDDCLERHRERVAVVRITRPRDVVEYFEWDPSQEDGLKRSGE